MKNLYFILWSTAMGLMLLFPGKSYSQFTAGNLCIMQVGDGVTTLTNTGNPMIIREFDTNGNPTYSVGVPTTGTNALIVSGAATSEGILSLSADKKILVFGGYLAPVTNTAPLAASASSVINRAIAYVNYSGTYSLAATSNTFFSSNNIRAAASDGSNNFWGSGANDGSDYFGNTSPAVNLQASKLNQRAVAIFNNQLFFSSASSAGSPTNLGVYAIGAGLPTSGSPTITNIINTGTGSTPVQFYFQTGPTPSVCYVADARASAGGGVQKWVFSVPVWTLAYTIPTSTASQGANGVVADFSGPNPIVYATTVEGTNNRLVKIIDNGASATATTIATSVSNSIFRGLAFAPCVSPSITATSGSGTLCTSQTLSLSVTTGGSPTFSYSWSGSGSFNSTAIANPMVTNPSTGNYNVVVTNACGTTSTSISVTTTPGPTVSVLSSSNSICSGQSATLTASGAASYSWNTGPTTSVIIVSPTTTTTYTVVGTSTNNCKATVAFTQTVTVCSFVKNNTSRSFDFVIYPNPARSNISVRTNPTLGPVDVKIFNSIGQMVLTENNYQSDKAIQINDLARGIYFVSVKLGENEISVQKLIVH
jgi:hypothetical protein